MNSPLYLSVVDFVDSSFGKHMPHFERTVFWLEQFLPHCGEAERIAAYSHDIERALRDKTQTTESFLGSEFLRMHQEGWAEIMRKFLTEKWASEEMISKVVHLISRHEVGGDDDQNALMDADSVSFFETNAESFVRNKVHEEGYEKIREKLEWMFRRIYSEIARMEAQKNYDYWMGELEKVK